ncbi:MAG: hypothetical protein ACI396_03195 [Acutalibacteraceae bacterium]
MLERIPPSLLNNIYNMLANGNEDICYFGTKLRTDNPEKATGSPLNFGISLLKINLIYRIPFLKSRKTDAASGIFELYHRRKVHEFIATATTMQSCFVNAFGGLLECPLGKKQFYRLLEKNNGIKRFAKTRAKYDGHKLSLAEIYERINSRLGCKADYSDEEKLIKLLYAANPYLIRAVEILRCCGVRVYAIAANGLSEKSTAELLCKNGIKVDAVFSTSDLKLSEKELLLNCGLNDDTAALGSDFRGFLKPLSAHGAKPYFYHSDAFLKRKVRFPIAGSAFADAYIHTLSSVLLNNSSANRIYELSFMYIAPVVYAAVTRLLLEYDGSPIPVCGLTDDFIPRLITDAFDAECRICENEQDDARQDLYEALSKYKIALSLISDREYSHIGAVAKRAVFDYCSSFHRIARHLDISYDELYKNADILYQSADKQISRITEEV